MLLLSRIMLLLSRIMLLLSRLNATFIPHYASILK